MFGARPYLLTVDADGRPRAISADVTWADGSFTLGAGKTTRANIGERPSVTLLWSPVEADGYSLIVDGDEALGADGDGVVITPTTAVLHRTRPRPEGAPATSACEMDCLPVLNAAD